MEEKKEHKDKEPTPYGVIQDPKPPPPPPPVPSEDEGNEEGDGVIQDPK